MRAALCIGSGTLAAWFAQGVVYLLGAPMPLMVFVGCVVAMVVTLYMVARTS